MDPLTSGDGKAVTLKLLAAAAVTDTPAPMPATVLKVQVKPGDTVKKGDIVVVLEAMKMELPLATPFDATVSSVHVAEGDRVGGGTLLVELDGS